jgi:sigma-E factor negative regulatory protein RseA
MNDTVDDMRQDPVLEQLSALADGELPRAEAQLLLARIAREPELARAWERYHVAGEAMRRNLAPAWRAGFADRVLTRLGTEPMPAPVRLPRALLRPLAGGAIAATVALLAVLGIRDQGAPDGEVVPTLAATDPLAVAGVPFGAERVEYDPQAAELEARLNSYLLDHTATTGGRIQGVAPYVRGAVVSTIRPVTPPVPPPTVVDAEARPEGTDVVRSAERPKP